MPATNAIAPDTKRTMFAMFFWITVVTAFVRPMRVGATPCRICEPMPVKALSSRFRVRPHCSAAFAPASVRMRPLFRACSA